MLHRNFIELHNRYKNIEWSAKPFSLEEVDRYLKEHFLAIEVNDKTYFGLINDTMVDTSTIAKLYKINNLEILQSLYSDEEKEEQIEIAREFGENETINELKIAIDSDDKIHITGYTLQGRCSKLYHTLLAFTGGPSISDCNVNNEDYIYYLEILHLAGII